MALLEMVMILVVVMVVWWRGSLPHQQPVHCCLAVIL